MDDKTCFRCGANGELFLFEWTNEDNEKQKDLICWNCDHDVSNGGDIYADTADIYQDRKEEAYAYDPINNERPY